MKFFDFNKSNSEEWLEAKMAKDKALGNIPESLKDNKEIAEFAEAQRRQKQARDAQGKFAIGRQAGLALGAAQRQQVDFSVQQDNLRQMFGHGDKIWGVNNEPVRINNDLNPSRADPWDETAGMFGFGGNGERSGLF